jgi:hypothetical protein
MKQLEARRLNQFFNSFVNEQRDKKKSNYDASLVVELTGPEFIGGATRDTNGDNLTVQLLTKTYTTDQVQFLASDRSNLIEIYFRAHAHERGEKTRQVLVVFRNKKNKRDSFSVPMYHHDCSRDESLDTLRRRLGFGWTQDMSEEMLALSKSIHSNLQSGARIQKVDREALESLGVKIETVMEYTHKLWITPQFIRQNKSGVVVGWMSFGTYASHPMQLKITKALKGVPLVRLCDLGAEASGYYDHHNKHTCRPEHAQALKSFAQSFKRQSKAKGA